MFSMGMMGHNRGAGAAPIIISAIALPYKYDAATDDVAYTISGICPSDTAIEIYDGATKLGDATVTDGAFTYTHTWTAVDASVQLKAVGNVSGDSEVVPMEVSQSNKAATNMAAWAEGGSGANYATTGGFPDPDGGNSAYQIAVTTGFSGDLIRLYTSLTWTPDDNNSSFSIWLGYTGSLDVARVWMYSATDSRVAMKASGHYAESFNRSYAVMTGKKVIGSVTWTKWVMQRVDVAEKAGFVYLDIFGGSALEISNMTYTAGQTMRVYMPKTISTALPLTIEDKVTMAYKSTSANGVEKYNMRHEYRGTRADFVTGNYGTTFSDVRVIRPDSWVEGTEYPVVWLPSPVFYSTYAATYDIMEQIALADYANTYNCVFIMCDISGNGMDYWNDYSDGVSKKHEQLFFDVLMPKAQEFWGASANPEKNLMIGWSKTGIGAVSFMFRRSEIGYVLADDLPYNMAYGDNYSNVSYGSSANFLLYNPKTIIGAARADIKTTNRILLVGGYSFGADMTSFKADMASNGILYTDLAYSEAAHTWQNAFNNIPAFMTFAGVA